MAATRTFAALIDQDSVVVLDYAQEKAGFRVVDTRTDTRRSTTAEAVADTVVQLLADMKAGRGVSLSVVLQHFGSFFHTLVLPPADDEVIRPIILREIQRSFNISDPAIAYTLGGTLERREAPRAGSATVPRQVIIAGAPHMVVDALQSRFSRARIRVAGITVIPEVCRRLYDALDGSTEATALLICLANGPHVAFFVNGRLELAIDPPLALEGEAPLDSALIVDQLERGAIFLKQQSRGTVATRLLLAAPVADYEMIASTIEARTGMHVAPFGRGIGTPETVIAMGAVLAAREQERLDLYPRTPPLDVRLRRAVAGPSAVVTAIMAAAALALLWCGIQFGELRRDRNALAQLQDAVTRGVPAVASMRRSADGRARIAGIRASLQSSQADRRQLAELLSSLAAAAPVGAQLDSFSVERVPEGIKTVVFGRAVGPTGAAAVTNATGMYHYLERRSPRLKDLDFQVSSYVSAPVAPAGVSPTVQNALLFTVTFVSPSAGER
jgi:hypothetical protein